MPTREERAFARIASRLVQALIDIETSPADPEDILDDAQTYMFKYRERYKGAAEALTVLRKHYLGDV